MARIIRVSLVVIVLLLTACRFSASRKEAIFRYAVAAILNIAASDETPIVERQQAAVPVEEPAAAVPQPPEPIEHCAMSIPVHPLAIDPAVLRPAAYPALAVEGRITIARVRTDAMRTIESERAACREAARSRIEDIVREMRAARVLVGPEGNACRFDIGEPQPGPSSSLEIEAVSTIRG